MLNNIDSISEKKTPFFPCYASRPSSVLTVFLASSQHSLISLFKKIQQAVLGLQSVALNNIKAEYDSYN